MVKKVRKNSSSNKLVVGTISALSVFALTAQANNTVEAKAKNTSNSAGQPASMSSSASALRNNGQLSLAPIQSSTASKSASVAKNGLYVVKSGDTLSELAVRFNVNLNDLVTWNHIQNPNLIYVGQQLLVNGQNVSSASTQSSAAVVAQPQSFSIANDAQQVQPQAVQGAASTAVQPQQVVNTTVQQPAGGQAVLTSQQKQQPSQMVNSAYTRTVTAAAYNSGVQSQQGSSAVATTSQQSSQQALPASGVQTVAYSAASQATTTNQPVAQSQQVTTSSVASQAAQVQPQQSQATQQVTNQQTTNQGNANLQSGSVVSLASKIASSNSVPYQWGGNSLNGMDCSGFVQYVYSNAEGKQLPHNTVAMESYVNQKPVNQAQSGDLLFWGNHGSTYHVGIYMGNNQYAAAAKPGTNVAVYNLSSYFEPSFAGSVK